MCSTPELTLGVCTLRVNRALERPLRNAKENVPQYQLVADPVNESGDAATRSAHRELAYPGPALCRLDIGEHCQAAHNEFGHLERLQPALAQWLRIPIVRL